jgi:hypothetical protein
VDAGLNRHVSPAFFEGNCQDPFGRFVSHALSVDSGKVILHAPALIFVIASTACPNLAQPSLQEVSSRTIASPIAGSSA